MSSSEKIIKRKETEERSPQNRMIVVMMWTFWAFVVITTLHYVRRVFIAERFNIPTQSMEPTLTPGDRVWVNKLLFGGRIYKSFDFERGDSLECFRMKGLRKVLPGDVICFNFPYGYDNPDKIEFRINYVYCKRVLGTPGDRIGAFDGHCWNDKVLRPIGVVEKQEQLRWMYDSIFIWSGTYDVIPLSRPRWNIKNWGPLTVPAKGLMMELDDFTRELYRQAIEYETGSTMPEDLTSYTFSSDWYFAVGDNAMDSYDSRYWGFIPEDFIIGIVGGRKVRNDPYRTVEQP